MPPLPKCPRIARFIGSPQPLEGCEGLPVLAPLPQGRWLLCLTASYTCGTKYMSPGKGLATCSERSRIARFIA